MSFPSCSWKTTFFKDSGGLAIYCDRASRAFSEYAGIFTLLSTEKPECLQVERFLANLSVLSFFSRKKLIIILRKYSDILSRFPKGT